MPSTPARTPDKPATPRPTDRPTALLSAGALAAFVAVSLVWPDRSAAAISTGFSWSARWFGAGWQLLLLATWVVAVLLALTPWAGLRGIGRRGAGAAAVRVLVAQYPAPICRVAIESLSPGGRCPTRRSRAL